MNNYDEYAERFMNRHKEYKGWNGRLPDEVAEQAVKYMNENNLWGVFGNDVELAYDELGINAMIYSDTDSAYDSCDEASMSKLDFETENYMVCYWTKR